ncbi:MAG: response regulator [Pararhodobacter sp.]
MPTSDFSDQEPLVSRKEPLRVLIVEDEAIISMELEMLLEDLKAEVVGIAMTAAEAEALVAQHRPDCVTMDINIQGDRDGVAAAHDIFERYGVRSIFVSAYSDAATRKRAETANPLGWVKKPVDIEELDLILRQVKSPGS